MNFLSVLFETFENQRIQNLARYIYNRSHHVDTVAFYFLHQYLNHNYKPSLKSKETLSLEDYLEIIANDEFVQLVENESLKFKDIQKHIRETVFETQESFVEKSFNLLHYVERVSPYNSDDEVSSDSSCMINSALNSSKRSTKWKNYSSMLSTLNAVSAFKDAVVECDGSKLLVKRK